MIFKKANNTQAYLKAGFMGFTGSGKTYTATQIAIGLHGLLKERGLPGGSAPIFFLDTETGSDWVEPAIKAAGIELSSAKTRAFVTLVPAMEEAAAVGGIMLIDSITHFWRELTESYAKKRNRRKGLEFQDWAYLKREWGKFTDVFVNSRCHIAMCGRAGFEYDFFMNDDGKKELEKTGIKMKAESETGYEPNILVLMEREQDITTSPISVWRTATVLKDRSTLLDGKQFRNPTFKDLLPHVSFLNLGGEQLGVDLTQNSEASIEKVDYSRQNEDAQRAVVLDEIKELLLKHYPSKSDVDKKAKTDLLETRAGTRSWERLTLYGLNELRDVYDKLLMALEKRHADGRDTGDDPFGVPAENGAAVHA